MAQWTTIGCAVGLAASPVRAAPPATATTASEADAVVGSNSAEIAPGEGNAVPAEPPISGKPAASSESRSAEPDSDSRQAEPATQVPTELRDKLRDIIEEAARDLGLHPVRVMHTATELDEHALFSPVENWRLQAQLLREERSLVLRLALGQPGQQILLVGRATVKEETLEVQAITLLRELQRQSTRPQTTERPMGAPAQAPNRLDTASEGRAILATNGALAGGYLGFALEHLGGSDDARLVFPLMTLGAGFGVGASLVAADEWNINDYEAWYLSASIIWPTTAGILIAEGQDLEQRSDRYGSGLIGTTVGITLGALGLTLGDVGSGGAILAHSGAFFGSAFGALGEMLVEGQTDFTPVTGIGIGIGIGTVATGALATFIDPSPSRILFIDLGATLGGLTAAAVASPVLFGDEVSETENQIWLSSVAGGLVAGGLVGYSLTTDDETASPPIKPFIGHADFRRPASFQIRHNRLDRAATRRPNPTIYGLHGVW